MIKIPHYRKILVLIVIVGFVSNPMILRMIRAQFPLGMMDTTRPRFEIEILIDGDKYRDDDRILRDSLSSGLCDPKRSIEILSNIANRTQDSSITKYYLGDLLYLTKTEDYRLFIQLNPNKIPYAEEIIEETKINMMDHWDKVIEASIRTKSGLKPYQILVVNNTSSNQNMEPMLKTPAE